MRTMYRPPDGRWMIITDGDGTLWECDMFYQVASNVCWGLLRMDWPDIPLSFEEVQQRRMHIQGMLLKRHKFYLTIFEDGWVEVYRQLCSRFHHPVDERTIVPALHHAAGTVHEAFHRVFLGVKDELGRLQSAGHRLHLVTLGEEEWQLSKVRRNGLESYFEDIHVVQDCKGKRMRRIAGDQPAMMVGDSLWSDIVPALHAGLYPVWIHTQDAWHNHGADDSHRTVQTISTFCELSSVIAHLNDTLPPAAR